MGKSSFSRKKERSKSSSSLRSKRKSKSRKSKLKKLRPRHDSASSYDTDLEGSIPVSSSSSESGKYVERSLSRKRKARKASKKSTKKRSRDHRNKDYSPRPKKRKDSKRDDDSNLKKNSRKKKRGRDVSISATSSDSLSCSTCQDGKSSDENETDRHRGRSEKRKRNSGKTEGSRYMTTIHSPDSLCGEGSDYHDVVEGDSFTENNFRQLKSIIVVPGDQQEDVSPHLHDDAYFRNLESDDMVSERELYHVANNEALIVENDKEVGVPKVKDPEVKNVGNIDKNRRVVDECPLNEIEKDCSGNDSKNGIDLESVLRQKALENLRRFKAVPQKTVESPSSLKVDHINVVKSGDDTFPRNEAEGNGVEVSGKYDRSSVNTMRVERNGAEPSSSLNPAVIYTELDNSSQNMGKISNGRSDSNKLNVDFSSLDQEVINENIDQKADSVICSTTNRSNLVVAALRPHSKLDSNVKEASAFQESIRTKPSISDVSAEIADNLTRTNNNTDEKTRPGIDSLSLKPSSPLKSISVEHNFDKSGHMNEEGSQFEQKTMSVMRGGEMVQVNYKVYIPKRAPLNRRQLKR